MLQPYASLPTAATDAWTGGDWALHVVLPLLLLAAGVVLYLLGRKAHAEAVRIKAGFGGPPGAVTAPSGAVDATGGSPLACSRPTSRRGQTKSSARPAGGASGSPLTSVRAASASTAAGREPGPPSN